MERAVVRDSERGRDDRVLRGCVGHRHHHLLGEPEPVHQRTVHLGQRAQTERVLDPRRRRVGVDERSHRLAHPCGAGKRSRHLDRRAERLRVAMDRGVTHRRDDHQAACELVDVGNRQGGVGEHGGVARHEGECVAGNERGSAWHRPGDRWASRRTAPALWWRGAARSAVPTLPPSRTGGNAFSVIMSVRASRIRGCKPLPSAASSLSRTRSIARTRSAERRGPELVACERNSCRAWESGSGTTRSRLPPTPVERP